VRAALALFALLIAAVPADAQDAQPVVRICRDSQYGDLGRGWRREALVAGPLAFVGLRDGYGFGRPAARGRAWPLKVLVVIEPRAVATVTIGARSAEFAALAYRSLRHHGGTVPLSAGTHAVRFEACDRVKTREPWNRGTQFGGYFLVRGRRCVDVEVQIGTRLLRRQLRFGVSRCARRQASAASPSSVFTSAKKSASGATR
jgi:hypothetical protein